MPVLANPKHEAYCKGIASGLKSVDAYEYSGYTRSPSAASQLHNKPEIQQRIQELVMEQQAKRAEEGDLDDLDDLPSELNREWLVKTLMKNVKIAQGAGQISPANKAVEMLAQLIGLGLKNSTPPPPDDSKGDEDGEKISMETMADGIGRLAEILDQREGKNAE